MKIDYKIPGFFTHALLAIILLTANSCIEKKSETRAKFSFDEDGMLLRAPLIIDFEFFTFVLNF